MDAEQLLTTAEVAQRLRIKPETLYAYVSRGLLSSVRLPGERVSRFRLSDVERVAARTQATRPDRDAPAMRTAITLIAYGHLHYRGRDAVRLSRAATFEEVAPWLWTGEWPQPSRFTAPAETVAFARAATAQLPPRARRYDRLPITVAVAGAMDPLRFDLAPATVTALGRSLIATMVDSLPLLAETAAGPDALLAERLWPRLTGQPVTPEGLHALNAALILLADHDLAASTIAVRVAASTRAHPYAAVSAGLGALDGPMHGAVGSTVYPMIATAMRDGPAQAIGEQLRVGTLLPGFGHGLYPDGDPRGTELLSLVMALPLADELRSALDALPSVAAGRGDRWPNIDYALAALAHATGMGAGAAEVIFSVARTAGWLAHIIEEYAQPPHRFRWRSGYTGPPPETP